MVDELLATRGIIVSHETVRQWALKFGQSFANQIRRRLPMAGDMRHTGEVVLTIAGVKHWLCRAVDQTGMVLHILVQSRRDAQAAKRLRDHEEVCGARNVVARSAVCWPVPRTSRGGANTTQFLIVPTLQRCSGRAASRSCSAPDTTCPACCQMTSPEALS